MENRWRFFRLFAILFAFTVLVLATPGTVGASNKAAVKRTEIEITPLENVGMGMPFSIEGLIMGIAGNPVPQAHITFSVDGNYFGQAESNEAGSFILKVTKIIPAGDHQLIATFKGSKEFSQANASINFKVLPAKVQVQTVPPIQGLSFRMAGKQFVSDRNGLATIFIEKAGQYRLDVLIDEYQNSDMKSNSAVGQKKITNLSVTLLSPRMMSFRLGSMCFIR